MSSGKDSHSSIYFIVDLRIQSLNLSLFSLNYREYVEKKKKEIYGGVKVDPIKRMFLSI